MFVQPLPRPGSTAPPAFQHINKKRCERMKLDSPGGTPKAVIIMYPEKPTEHHPTSPALLLPFRCPKFWISTSRASTPTPQRQPVKLEAAPPINGLCDTNGRTDTTSARRGGSAMHLKNLVCSLKKKVQRRTGLDYINL